MPLYDYKCFECGDVSEEFFSLKEKPVEISCIVCNSKKKPIPSIGGIQGDELPSWLRHPEALGCLQPRGERRIETRGEYKKYLKSRGIEEHGTK